MNPYVEAGLKTLGVVLGIFALIGFVWLVPFEVFLGIMLTLVVGFVLLMVFMNFLEDAEKKQIRRQMEAEWKAREAARDAHLRQAIKDADANLSKLEKDVRNAKTDGTL